MNAVAHDINNYMGGVTAYAELVLRSEGLGTEPRRMLNEIVNSAGRCAGLVSSLTTVARKEKPSTDAVDPIDLLNQALMLRLFELRRDSVKVETKLPEEMGVIAGDTAKLQMAILCLLMNAHEAAVEVERRLVRVGLEEKGEGVEYVVWDSGPEIPEDRREMIFDPLFTTKGPPHVGLGLSVVRACAALHGGHIRYTPERGFVLYLRRHLEL